MRFGGGLEESVAVGDILRLDPTVQIYSDVVKWRFDNPYDYRPEEYDQLDKIYDEFYFGGKPEDDATDPWDWDGIIYYEDAPESNIVSILEDKEHYYHRIDDLKLYTDNKNHQNDIYEDIAMTVDSENKNIKPDLDEFPFYIYSSSLYNSLKIEDYFEYNWLNNYVENISDRDLCIVTKPYNYKFETRLNNIKFNEVTYDIDISNSRIGVFVRDINHLMVYTDNTWKTIKIPVISDIFNRIDPPSNLNYWCRELCPNSVFLNNLTMPDKYYNFIKFFLYIPAHSKAILPELEYVGRLKHY